MGVVYLLVGLLGFVLLFVRVASRTYATEVVRAANGMINELAIVPPSHSPHVSEPVTRYPANAPAWTVTASKMKARVAVQNTSRKLPRTSLVLRFKAASGPKPSLLITGANSDQRVSSHSPGSISRPVAAVGTTTAGTEATTTGRATGVAWCSLPSTPNAVMRFAPRSASVATSSA